MPRESTFGIQALELQRLDPASLSGSVRVAPLWDGKILASLWRIWVNGDDIYVGNRNSVNAAKASLHKSGHWTFNAGHMRTEFAPARPLSTGPWKFALKLSFMIDQNTRPLREGNKFKPGKPVTLFTTPPGSMLAIAVLIADPGVSAHTPPPAEFPGDLILRTTMRNQRPVIAVAAVFPMPAQDLAYMLEMRKKAGKWPPSDTNPNAAELCIVNSDPNVITIIPLREEDFTTEEAPPENTTPPGRENVTTRPGEILMLMLVQKQ